MLKRLLPAAFVALAASGAAAAAQSPLAVRTTPAATGLPVDRIVAVVGDQPIMFSQVAEVVAQRRAAGSPPPTDSAAWFALARQVLDEIVDQEVMLIKAKAESVTVNDDEVAEATEQRYKEVRGQFRTEAEFRETLKNEGFGSPEEFRRWLGDQARRRSTQQKLIEKLRQGGKLAPAPVSDAEVNQAFQRDRATLPKRPATVTFRQIVVPARPTDAARQAARAKAESLLVEIRKGGDFEQIAKRESMDAASRELGGDLGWTRRGRTVPEFESVLFALQPGQVSGVVETSFGYHIIKVDRVNPAEVKGRHILIKQKVDSADVARARAEADTVLAQWRAGVPFDTLVAKHHDKVEEKLLADPFPREQLPPAYQTALEGAQDGTIVGPFPIEDRVNNAQKMVVLQLMTSAPGGEYTVTDLRTQIREQLAQQKSYRSLLDRLRRETYVSIRL
ncbi:MAG: peptidylprolyl isomerase [Gemmatimonadaceae bacterium]